jgi:outer membrane protease
VVKKIFFLLLSAAPLALSAAGEPGGNVSPLTLEFSLGLLSGRAEELVYQDENSGDKLSQLLWDLKPLVYTGAGLRYHRQSRGGGGFFAEAMVKLGIPGETGVMEDRDWMGLNAPQWLTHYSVHTNRTDWAVLFDGSLGLSFPVWTHFLLKISVAYHFMNFYWMGKGGSLLYPYPDSHGYITTATATVITYQQIWHAIGPAVSFYGAFNRYFSMELAFNFSPLVFFAGLDNHILRVPRLVITGKYNGGFSIQPGLVFSFAPKGSLVFSLSLAYRRIRGTRGDGYYDEQGSPLQVATNANGAGYSVFDVGFNVRFGF